MNIKSYALGGAVALAMLSPAGAFTFHPATPAEIKQTDDLNARALANAQGQDANTTNANYSNPNDMHRRNTNNGNMNGNGTMSRVPANTSEPPNDLKTNGKLSQQPGSTPSQNDDNSVTPAPTNQ